MKIAPILIIFGITGDLSKRKLLPALYHLFSQDVLSPDTKIIGVSRHPLDIDELLQSVELCVLEKDNVCDPEGIRKLRTALESFQLNPENTDDYARLKGRLEEIEAGTERNRLFYMSIPPAAYPPIIDNLARVNLNQSNSTLLLEKPFGYDLETAQELITLVDDHFQESQVYRIDHYLAKETAQNLLAFRASNPIFQPLWSGEYIDSVHIRATETIGIEGRADFYESTGALRDLVQSHLLQLLAITLMEVPTDMSSQRIQQAKQTFFEQLRPADPAEAVRGQYASYAEEVGAKSRTETYAKLHLRHAAERWRDVDIILETGKALAEKKTEIIIGFRTPHDHPNNNLTFEIQPSEGIKLELMVKQPGFETIMSHTSLDFDYKKGFQDEQHIDAYERVLMDAVRGDLSLSISAAQVIETWRVLQPLLSQWSENDDGLILYPVGADPETIGR